MQILFKSSQYPELGTILPQLYRWGNHRGLERLSNWSKGRELTSDSQRSEPSQAELCEAAFDWNLIQILEFSINVGIVE